MDSFGQKARDNWSVVFAGLVIAFLALSAVNGPSLPGWSTDNQESAGDVGNAVQGQVGNVRNAVTAVSPRSSAASTAVASGNLSFEVAAFRIIEADDGGYQARVTLDVTNNGTDTGHFHPERVLLSRNGGPAIYPTGEKRSPMSVSTHISQLAPLTFDVNATPGAVYKLTYDGKTLFNGPPF